ncbi:hypothetical protein [Lutibacter sp.]|uniref:hypothetical protein n=1 Tax=Lutibacter sp. TaxID=1925666 RepID=UPI0025B7D998|nr:hypothetical protein [Lutibacter sp.]MCF6168394.1 hypothetical protein [Lutibacter sp.]
MNSSIYGKAKELIKNNDIVINYTNNQLKVDGIKIFVSDEKVPFNLTSLEINILKSDYIKGFNEFSNHSKEEESIIKSVTDSLYRRDLFLNKGFNTKISNDKSAKTNMGKYNYILFFSDVKDGQLFGQLIPYNYKINKNISFGEVSFGTGFSFLFNINENNNIIKTYFDKVNFN